MAGSLDLCHIPYKVTLNQHNKYLVLWPLSFFAGSGWDSSYMGGKLQSVKLSKTDFPAEDVRSSVLPQFSGNFQGLFRKQWTSRDDSHVPVVPKAHTETWRSFAASTAML